MGHLKVGVVGAGIGGLAAAIGLRRAGHEVEVGQLLLYRQLVAHVPPLRYSSNPSSSRKSGLQLPSLPMALGSLSTGASIPVTAAPSPLKELGW